MTENEIAILQQACKAAGVDSSKIKPENPFTRKGFTATMLQGAVSEIAPDQAAQWRVDAGGSLSVATLSEMQSGEDLSDKAMSDLWLHDPIYVKDKMQEASKSEERVLASLDAKTDQSRRRREGDEAVDFQVAKTEAQKEAQAESVRRHQELQSRMDARRQREAAESGRFIQS